MRVIFAGTPEFSLSSLDALVAHPGVELVAVYTQPDRPAGRGKKLTPSPIKSRALALNIPVFQPLSFKVEGAIEQLASQKPDLMVVTAFGLILPQRVLDIPRLGCVNVHASLLPRWRGAAPIQRSIEAGDRVTGVTLMQMEAGLDTGPMLATTEVAIDDTDTGGSLHDKLSVIGGRLLSDALDAIAGSALVAEQQQEENACYANKLMKSEAVINWQDPAELIARRTRAFNPWPMANTVYGETVLRILQASARNEVNTSAVAGTITAVNDERIEVTTGCGVLDIFRIQKAGGKPMAVKDFMNGMQLQVGDRFGQT